MFSRKLKTGYCDSKDIRIDAAANYDCELHVRGKTQDYGVLIQIFIVIFSDSACSSVVDESALHDCIYAMSSRDVFNAYPIAKWEQRHFRDLPKEHEHDVIRGLITVDGTCSPQRHLVYTISVAWTCCYSVCVYHVYRVHSRTS